MLRFDPMTEKWDTFRSSSARRTYARSTAARARCGRPSRAPTRSWCTATLERKLAVNQCSDRAKVLPRR